MELHLLMRTSVIDYEEFTAVLGVYDDDHIKEATNIAKEQYDSRDIWVDVFDLNNIDTI